MKTIIYYALSFLINAFFVYMIYTETGFFTAAFAALMSVGSHLNNYNFKLHLGMIRRLAGIDD